MSRKIILRIMKTILRIVKNICILYERLCKASAEAKFFGIMPSRRQTTVENERLCKASVRLCVKCLEGTNVASVRTNFRTRHKPYISDGFEVQTIHSQPT